MQSLQVLKSEERAATDVLDDKTSATRPELPLYNACKQAVIAFPTPGFHG